MSLFRFQKRGDALLSDLKSASSSVQVVYGTLCLLIYCCITTITVQERSYDRSGRLQDRQGRYAAEVL